MSGAEITVLAGLIIFGACVALIMSSRKQGSSKISINPLTGRLEHTQGSEPAGTTIRNAKTGGGVNAVDNTGGGVELDGIEAKNDINATNNPPPANPKV